MDTRHSLQNQAFTALSVAEASTLDALFEQLFPADENGPGASLIGVTQYLDRALSGPYAHHLETYRLGVYAAKKRVVGPVQGGDAASGAAQEFVEATGSYAEKSIVGKADF